MVSQERAERTRQRLLQAAATEFAQHGYGGTSLQRISSAAGVTMGALTFHFPTKIDLAGAVHAHGSALTRAAVEHVAAAHADTTDSDHDNSPVLQRVIGVTHALARLLHEEATVRAAGRLSRERTLGQVDWNDSWLPCVDELLERADEKKELRAGVDPKIVALLTRYLVSGLEASAQPTGGCSSHLRTLSEVWDVVLSGATGAGRRRPRTRDRAY
ncbi:TetR family transcriptional regulator [Streptomyces sp. NPDC006551]|uniref:TetR family transcriptional regulator n=1 Tax=Streptomyces sp. NPDC006551 TaxID=3157178 RepID=UPI0033AD59BB